MWRSFVRAIFSGSSAPALHEHPINKDLIAHFKSKGGDSVSWWIAKNVERYEEHTGKKVLRGADITSLFDQETERKWAEEVANRINKALREIRAKSCTCTAPPRRGHLEFMKYLHENGCAWNESACAAAACSGHLECLKYLHENGCPWDKETCEAAAEIREKVQ